MCPITKLCFSPVCKEVASYATCFIPVLEPFYAFITELTAEEWLERRGFRDFGGNATKVINGTRIVDVPVHGWDLKLRGVLAVIAQNLSD